MPQVIEYTKTLYQFAELSDSAKETARQWWRDSEIECGDLLESLIDDFEMCAERLGITFDSRSVKLHGGGTRQHATIYFSGFSSQGDGACFEGSYSYKKGAAKLIRDHAPKDAALHSIADKLQAIQAKNFYALRAIVKHRGHYYHQFCTSIDVSDARSKYGDCTQEAESEIADCLRDFMIWIYRQLEAESDYRLSDENVDESILINEYTFTETGKRDD